MKTLCILLSLLSFIPSLSATPHVLGVGTACVDTVVSVTDEILQKEQLVKGSCIVLESTLFNETLKKICGFTPPFTATGGACANTIKGLKQLNIQCSYLTRMGEDGAGDFFSKTFNLLGVDLRIKNKTIPTKEVASLVTPDGERTFFVSTAEEGFCTSLLSPHEFSDIDLVHLDGYLLQKEGFVETILSKAKEAGCLVSFDLSDALLVTKYKERLKHDCFSFVDILFVNEQEALALTGLPAEEAWQELKLLCPLVVVKMGEKGCWVATKEKDLYCPGFPVCPLDTTGAGDLFASGFLFGILQQKTLEECALLGNILGSAVVQYIGAEIPLEKWREIAHYFEPQKEKSSI